MNLFTSFKNENQKVFSQTQVQKVNGAKKRRERGGEKKELKKPSLGFQVCLKKKKKVLLFKALHY